MGGMQRLPSSPLSHPLHNAKGMGKGRQVLNNLGVVGEYYISSKIREGFEQRNIRRNMGRGGELQSSSRIHCKEICAYGGDRSCVTEWPPKENLHPQSRFYLLRTARLEVDVLIRSQDARLLSSASGSLYHATLPRHVGRTQPVKRRQSLSRRRRGGRCCGALHHT